MNQAVVDLLKRAKQKVSLKRLPNCSCFCFVNPFVKTNRKRKTLFKQFIPWLCMEKNWIIIGLISFLTLSIIFFSSGYQPADSPQQNMSKSWMFKVVYATYEGKIDSLSIPYTLDEKIQVTDLNATHVQIQTDSSIKTSISPTLSDQTILWVNKTNVSFQPKGERLEGMYSTQITVKGIGIRDCIAYEYVNEAINATYYIDKVFLWPIRIVYFTSFENQIYVLEFSLKETNINGLT